ncbi:helix-turn-helix domain-containing protein [Microbacterium sp.]|uniref:helix-turn-helix domain-containing protein n=1 Tax=Microbacterium sp. TaxID=51671 RepID=UPI0039E6D1AB
MMDQTRGVLYPARLPEFHRLPPPAAASALVQWFWIPQWSIAPGRSSRQEVVGYPAVGVVVEPSGVIVVGAATTRTHRDLRGTGWAVGALLRPAAVPALVARPAELVDTWAPVDAVRLHAEVCAAMAGVGERARAAAVDAFACWLGEVVGAPTERGLLANTAAELLLTDREIVRVADAAGRLHVSARTLERLMLEHVGVGPSAMIRRRRLQEAAQRVRDDPDTDLAALAAALGYADHAHLTHDFRAVLGFTPSAYRGSSPSHASRAGASEG